jgi:hypothetical protein
MTKHHKMLNRKSDGRPAKYEYTYEQWKQLRADISNAMPKGAYHVRSAKRSNKRLEAKS